jgi:hypothetical protein
MKYTYEKISLQHSLSTSLANAPQNQLGYVQLSGVELASVGFPKLIQACGTINNPTEYILSTASHQAINCSTVN